jgi:hypothetical protein
MLGNESTAKKGELVLNNTEAKACKEPKVTLVYNPRSVVIDQGAEPYLHLAYLY